MQVCTGVTERPGPDPWVLHFSDDDRNPPIGLRGTCHGVSRTVTLVFGQTGHGLHGLQLSPFLQSGNTTARAPNKHWVCGAPLSGALGRPLNCSLCPVNITRCISSQLTDNLTARGQELREPVFPQKERKSLFKLTEAVCKWGLDWARGYGLSPVMTGAFLSMTTAPAVCTWC